MELWNEAFLESSLAHLDRISENAVYEQKALLLRLLRENQNTVFGRVHGFAGIHSEEDYRAVVPVTDYANYRELIHRMQKGERNLLTAASPAVCSISSGSTGEPKCLPLTEEDVQRQHLVLDGMVMGRILQSCPEIPARQLFGRILEIGNFYRTSIEDGTPSAVRSGAWYRVMEERGLYRGDPFSAPFEVLFPRALEDMTYVMARCALALRDITAIHGVFMHSAVTFFHFIRENWDALLSDMETGTVSEQFHVSHDWQAYLAAHCQKDPVRAGELRAVGNAPRGLLRRIWPSLFYIRVIGGEQFRPFEAAFHAYTEGVAWYGFAYACSESNLGVAAAGGGRDHYQLLSDTCYFEFLPADEENAADADAKEEGLRTRTFADVEVGRRYELVITTLSGLYRYRLGDVVEITGKEKEAPVVRVLYRKGWIMNLAEEKLTATQLENAAASFFEKIRIKPSDYALCGAQEGENVHYRLYAERPDRDVSGRGSWRIGDETPGRILDRALQEENRGYRTARSAGDLAEADFIWVVPGTFAAWQNRLRETGRRTEQMKPVKIIANEEMQAFFDRNKAAAMFAWRKK